MDLSYAANLEDYHLACAFAGQPDGFYIDVGAGHPVADNVSCWFYLQGWRGLVVEPQSELIELYPLVRPRDIAVPRLLGRTAGQVDFHVVDRLSGFSSILAEHAGNAAKFGATFQTVKAPMTTLAALCEEHGVGTIDFLKIDVEGAEGDVLLGSDFRRWRPRVVLVEALAPVTMAESFADWEPVLLDHGYVFALFDGLNRFYVAREDERLIARFPRTPAPWLVVPHLGHTNRAPERSDHLDHAFARALVENFLAALPAIDRDLLLALMLEGSDAELARRPGPQERAEALARVFPLEKHKDAVPPVEAIEAATVRELYARLMDTDPFRVMLGRIAASYDGGQILEQDPSSKRRTRRHPMQPITDTRYYEVERRAYHAQRPGFRIAELEISPAQKVPWHYHSNIQDTFYVVSGTIRIFLRDPDEEVRLKAGETYAVPPRRPHLVTNPGDSSAVFLVLQGLGEYDFVPLGS